MNRTRNRTSLFLIELLIAILFFSLTATVAIRLFALSHKLAEESKMLNFATNMCASVAEVFEAADGDLEKMSKILGGEMEGDALAIYCNSEWKKIEEKENSTFRVSVTVSGNDNLAYAKIVAYEESTGKTIYSLEDGKYCPQSTSDKEDNMK